MSNPLPFDNKKALEDASLEHEQEEDSRLSTTTAAADEDVRNETRTRTNDEGIRDKEAQLDARSTITTESAIPPPPDGGLHAWLKVFGGFMIYINIWSVPHLTVSTIPQKFSSFIHTNTQLTNQPTSQGFHTNLRRLPILLQNLSPLLLQPVSHILDRHRASLAPHHHRRALRPSIRPRIFPPYALRGELLSRPGNHDVEFEQDVLAGFSEPGSLHGCWGGDVVYS